MNFSKNYIHVSFSAYCQTNFGETVCIVGNSSQLGNWTPILSLKLQTTPKEYPIWYSKGPIIIQKLTCIQFKICVIGKNGQIVRWQNLQSNRTICLKKSCSIFISDSEKETEIDDDDQETIGSEEGTPAKKSKLTQIKQQQNQDEVFNELDKIDQQALLKTATSLKDSYQRNKEENQNIQTLCESLKAVNILDENGQKQRVQNEGDKNFNQKQNIMV